MPGPKGYRNVQGMRGRRKGGKAAETPPPSRDPLGLSSLVDQWLQTLETKGYAEQTLSTNTWALKTFLGWAAERDLDRPEQIHKPMLESYQRWLYRYRKPNGEPLGITTQRARLGALQRFFAWLCRQNLLHANPAADLELPRKRPRNLPKALSLDEVNDLLNLPDIRDPLGIRDRAMLEVFYATGLRRSELVNLDHEDLERSLGVLRIRKGKGDRSRMVPLGSRALLWICRYLDEVRPMLASNLNEHALFLSGYGERFSASYVGNWVRKQMNKAEIGRTGSCHLLRHSCATHMLEGGADIKIIQQLLGHARLDTTQIYTEVGIQTLREVHGRTHPSCAAKENK
jgi:integrase/recombinase XerD